MLNEKDEGYLTQLVIKAKQKVKAEYDIEIEKEATIDMDKTLEQNRALIIQAIRTEKDLKLKARGENPIPQKVVTTSTTSKEDKKKEEEAQAKAEAEKKAKELETLREYQNIISDGLLDSPQFWQMSERIKMVVGGHCDVCFIISEGGWSKTHTGFQLTKGKDVVYISCKATPLELYIQLYQNKDRELIILDDLKYNNDIMVSILKGAWQKISNKRVVQYNSSRLPNDIPSIFDIKARFICFANKIPNNIDISALISRTVSFEFKPSYQEKIHLIEQISKQPYKNLKDEQKNEILEFIKKHTSPATENLSLRTFLRVCDFYEYSKDWKKLALGEIKVDERLAIVLKLDESGLPVNEQISKFKENCNESRATFFRLKQKI